MTDTAPFLWFEKDAEAAIRHYIAVVPNSRLDSIGSLPADSPSGPAGSLKLFEFTLAGRRFQAMEAGKLDPFNHAVSLMVECDSQAEIDQVWDGLLADGGAPQQCGWLQDRWGLYWQVVPRELIPLMKSPDRVAAKRLAEAMMTMVKFDVAALKKAYTG